MSTATHTVFASSTERAICGTIMWNAKPAATLPGHFYPPLTRKMVRDALEAATCFNCSEILRREVQG